LEIGGMNFFESEESAHAITLPESQVTLVPQAVLPLAEAQAKLPYSISLPAWAPEGFKMGTSVRISHFPGAAAPQVTTTWYGSDTDMGHIELTIYGQRIDWLVETNDVQEVQVNGQPAALVEGGWDADTGQWNREAARMLNWMKGNEMYQLHSPGVSVEDLIRMAESIP
jgi:cation diffusion facilitator CzcD-associated flavoprotein CzcO